jgi:hypothetical protein
MAGLVPASTFVAGPSRSKNGVLKDAYVPAIYVFEIIG